MAKPQSRASIIAAREAEKVLATFISHNYYDKALQVGGLEQQKRIVS